MKTIGFFDYYLSEWHANNYPAWIREINPEFTVAYAWAELDVSPVDGVTTDEWCAKFGARRCGTIEEVCEKADFLIVLSPDNPERHLDYAKRVFPCGKPCYMDKTFAPDAETAKKIFALAKIAFDGHFDGATIKKWLAAFYRRFFTQQFKRSCMPDGVKVGTVCLSPRGDWRMPSEASFRLWMEQVEQL